MGSLVVDFGVGLHGGVGHIAFVAFPTAGALEDASYEGGGEGWFFGLGRFSNGLGFHEVCKVAVLVEGDVFAPEKVGALAGLVSWFKFGRRSDLDDFPTCCVVGVPDDVPVIDGFLEDFDFLVIHWVPLLCQWPADCLVWSLPQSPELDGVSVSDHSFAVGQVEGIQFTVYDPTPAFPYGLAVEVLLPLVYSVLGWGSVCPFQEVIGGELGYLQGFGDEFSDIGGGYGVASVGGEGIDHELADVFFDCFADVGDGGHFRAVFGAA